MTDGGERRDSGVLAWLDRGAWAAMAQDDPGEFSWPKALVTIAAGIALAIVIYATFFESISFLLGLTLAYAFLLYRARSVHVRHVRGRAGG